MPRIIYRLFDETSRVSTAVKLKDGSILMVYPRMENFADIALWQWVVEHEEGYADSSLILSTQYMNLSLNRDPEPLSPYTPPLAPMEIDPFKLGPTVEGIPFWSHVTPPVSPRPEFQEPLPSTPSQLGPSQLRATEDGSGYESNSEVDTRWLIKHELQALQTDLATMSQTIHTNKDLMDVRLKAILKKLD